MNQEKIGKFISSVRKEKKITQKQLAEKLGITDRAISKWENGKSMPDLALLKPLSECLDITINELLSGEYISKKEKVENLEENIVNAINYSKKKQYINELIFYLFILLFGSLMIIISMSVFNTPIGFTSCYSIIGTYILMIIFSYLLKKFITSDKEKKYIILLIISFFILYFVYLWLVDFVNVKKNNAYPDIFVTTFGNIDNDLHFDTAFYDLYICNANSEKQYRKIVFDMNHDINIKKINDICNH
ncbi:MAG: helix-turn-helix transcriptional regulator [Bacilli bacterium]|nr:helix-turn-helix transcriptional regulator [Bacilli bacterium]